MTWVNIENGENALSIRNKINALGADVDTKAEQSDFNGLVSTVGTKADLVSGKVPESQIPSFVKTDSYMAWVTNANTNALDAAFGKNNDNLMRFLGHQLAMYAWFKGNSKTTYPFTNLQLIHNLTDLLATAAVYNEVRASQTLMDLITSSPYAKAASLNVLPLDGTIPCAVSLGAFVSLATARSTGYVYQSITISVAGYYNLYCAQLTGNFDSGSDLAIGVNGVSVATFGRGSSATVSSRYLNAGDVVSVFAPANITATSMTILCPLIIRSLKPIVLPATVSAGTRIIQTLYTYNAQSGTNSWTVGSVSTAYTFSAITKAGTYRLQFEYTCYESDHPGSFVENLIIDVRKNGTVVASVSGLSGERPATLVTNDIACAVGDVLTVTRRCVDNPSPNNRCMPANQFIGATLSIAATDVFPA